MDVTRIADYQPPPPTPPARVEAPIAPVAPPEPPSYVAAERQGDSHGALDRAVRAINSTISNYSRHLGISFHEPTRRNVVTVYDSTTNEAIREIPPQRVLDAHASLLELAGLFVDQRG